MIVTKAHICEHQSYATQCVLVHRDQHDPCKKMIGSGKIQKVAQVFSKDKLDLMVAMADQEFLKREKSDLKIASKNNFHFNNLDELKTLDYCTNFGRNSERTILTCIKMIPHYLVGRKIGSK